MTRRKHKSSTNPRKGTAVSELAVCLPVVTLIVFAAIQGSELMFLKQSLSVAAYEGCRQALHPDGSQNSAESAASSVLQDRNITSGTVQFTPSSLSNVKPGEYISVTVTAPVAKNSTLKGWMFAPDNVSSSVTMMYEY